MRPTGCALLADSCCCTKGRFGSLAANKDDISLTSAFGCIADIKIAAKLKLDSPLSAISGRRRDQTGGMITAKRLSPQNQVLGFLAGAPDCQHRSFPSVRQSCRHPDEVWPFRRFRPVSDWAQSLLVILEMFLY